MESRDYLKRQIDQLGKALGKLLSDILDLKETGKTALAIETVSQTLHTALDYDIEALLEIPEESFLTHLQEDKKLDRYHLDTLSDILYETATAYDQKLFFDKAEGLFRRAKILYDHLNQMDTTYSFNRYQRVKKIMKKYDMS